MVRLTRLVPSTNQRGGIKRGALMRSYSPGGDEDWRLSGGGGGGVKRGRMLLIGASFARRAGKSSSGVRTAERGSERRSTGKGRICSSPGRDAWLQRIAPLHPR